MSFVVSPHFYRICTVVALAINSLTTYSSPWVEADDAYLKADLILLVDAGIIKTPLHTFPMPWHAIANDIKQASIENQPSHVIIAYRHIQHALETAQLGRGNTQLKITAANGPSQGSFGQYNANKWQLTAAHNVNFKNIAARLNLNYGQKHGLQNNGEKHEDDVNFDGSFFAYTTGSVDFTLGSIHKWWSPSWQSSLAQPFLSRAAPSFFVTYNADDNAELNGLHVELGVSDVNDVSPYQKKWAGRINFAINEPISIAASYIQYQGKTDNISQQWFWYDVLEQQETSNKQFIIEGRVTLPSVNGWYSGIYSQHLFSDSTGQEGSNITGFETQGDILNTQVRFVAEYRSNALAKNEQLNNYLTELTNTTSNVDKNSIKYREIYQVSSLSNQLSVGAYVQLENNHQFNVFYHWATYQKTHHRVTGEYKAPLYDGQVSVQLSMSNADLQTDNIQLATSWEYRF
jgi:hypothetical protein